MRKLQSAVITSALTTAMVIAPTMVAGAAPATKLKGDVLVPVALDGGRIYDLSIAASGPSAKPSGGFTLIEASGGKDADLVAGRIRCFAQVGDTFYLVGQITNDEGTVFGDGVDEPNDYTLITIVDNGSTGDQIAIAPTNSGDCNVRITDSALLTTVSSGTNITVS